MKYEELYRRVFDELGDGSGRASYDTALLRALAPLLPSTESPKNTGFVYLHCPMCGYKDCQRPEVGYCCRKCGKTVEPSRLNRVPVMNLDGDKAEILIGILVCLDMISPFQSGWAKEYFKRDPEAFWNYIKSNTNRKGEVK